MLGQVLRRNPHGEIGVERTIIQVVESMTE